MCKVYHITNNTLERLGGYKKFWYNRQPDDSLTIHLPADLKGILYAEAIVAQKSMSALVRQWIEERLGLPEPAIQ